MMERGDAVSIVVAPGRLWLIVAYVNDFMHGLDLSIRGGAKIIAINPACVFRDKVSVGKEMYEFLDTVKNVIDDLEAKGVKKNRDGTTYP